jgi:hypothetical protein
MALSHVLATPGTQTENKTGHRDYGSEIGHCCSVQDVPLAVPGQSTPWWKAEDKVNVHLHEVFSMMPP